MSKDFHHIVQERLNRKADETFDQVFWSRFDREFSSTRRRRPSWWKVLVPTGVVAMALIFAFYPRPESPDSVEIAGLLQHQELLMDLELLEAYDEFGSLTEKEWAMLLGETNE